MKTIINFTEYTRYGPCDKCGIIGPHGERHVVGLVPYGGIFRGRLSARQGDRVKKYRNMLKRNKIDFTETLLINTCVCHYGFKTMCKPGTMVVIFTWE